MKILGIWRKYKCHESVVDTEIAATNSKDESEIEDWIETLPYPLASILWANKPV
jgi:hypothetical protein